MGRLEKIVVLTVLFLVAVILAISLNQGDKKKNAGPMAALDPALSEADGAPASPGSAGMVPGARPASPEPRTGTPAGAMNAALRPPPTAAPSSTHPALANHATGSTPPSAVRPLDAPPAGSMLRTLGGLEESLFNDLYTYTWKSGDTFAALAERYYGSQKLALRLRTANEGRTEATLKPGDRIFVPNLEAATPAVAAPASATNGATPIDAGTSLAPEPATAKKNGVGADGMYVVQKGDVLGTISQKVYGTAKKWQKIYDANRDVLRDPNSLTVGMKLRIPE